MYIKLKRSLKNAVLARQSLVLLVLGVGRGERGVALLVDQHEEQPGARLRVDGRLERVLARVSDRPGRQAQVVGRVVGVLRVVQLVDREVLGRLTRLAVE